MEGQHAADKLLSINRAGVYVAEYTFSDCQFLSRRAASFFSFLFPSYILFCHAVSPSTQIPLFRGVGVVFSETRRWHVAVGPSNRYLACRAQCHGVIRDFFLFRGRLEKGSFFLDRIPHLGDGLMEEGWLWLLHRLFLFLLRVWEWFLFNYCSLFGCILASW